MVPQRQRVLRIAARRHPAVHPHHRRVRRAQDEEGWERQLLHQVRGVLPAVLPVVPPEGSRVDQQERVHFNRDRGQVLLLIRVGSHLAHHVQHPDRRRGEHRRRRASLPGQARRRADVRFFRVHVLDTDEYTEGDNRVSSPLLIVVFVIIFAFILAGLFMSVV